MNKTCGLAQKFEKCCEPWHMKYDVSFPEWRWKGLTKILNIYPISRIMWWQQLSLEDRMASCPEKDEDSFLGLYFLLFLQKHDNVLNHSVSFQVFLTYWVRKFITYKLKRKFSVEKLNTFNDWKANSSISQVASTFTFLRQCNDH